MNYKFISNQQKFTDNYDFVNEYFKLLTQYYSGWNYQDVKCTYYSLDIENSIIDDKKLNNGSYEMIGELSGWKWRKILNLQLNNVDAVSTTPTSDEGGVTNKEKLTTAWFPSLTCIEAHVHDFVCFSDCQNSSHYYLRNPPLFEVVNVERSPDFDQCFYKISLKVSYISQKMLDPQIDGLFYYMTYEDKIYGIDNSICLHSILDSRDEHCCNYYYNNNTGLYFDKIDFT